MRFRRRRPSRLSPVVVGAATDAGPRPENQDRWAADGDAGWALVCDGVGGHRGGAAAASLTAATAAPLLPGDPTGAVRAANDAVLGGRADDEAVSDMASTLTIAVRTDERRWSVLQLGDSPAWVVGAGGARSVTFDHNLVGDLVRSGAITADEAIGHRGRHVITRAVGIAAVAEPEAFEVDLADDEVLVLASDGLSDVAMPADVVTALGATTTAQEAADALVALALARDTADNVTVVVLR